MKLKTTLAAALLAAAGGAASAAAVDPVSYAAFSGSLVTFNELVTDPEGSLIDGLLTSGGVQFGKRFDGQELATTKVPWSDLKGQYAFDSLAFGTPTAGLTLLAGATGRNLGAYDYGDADGTALAGIGPGAGAYGEPFGFGAISARFASGVSTLGFQLRDADEIGSGWLSLYRADGSLIQTLDLGVLANGYYAFARAGGVSDIAGFSLTHTDPYYGIALDNLKYAAAAPVPEPGQAALLLAGLFSLGAIVRRRLSSDAQ